MMSTSQQESLKAQGVSRHMWERYPLARHSVLFLTRAWEIGRMTAYVKNHSSDEEKERQLKNFENMGWMKEIPEPEKGTWK